MSSKRRLRIIRFLFLLVVVVFYSRRLVVVVASSMKRGVEARLCWSSRRLYRRPSSFVRVFEVVDVVQKQREENAGDDARDDRRRGRESDAFFASSSFFLR